MKINRIASGLLLTVALAVVSCGTERSDDGKLAKETEAVGLRCRNLIDPEGVDKASLSWRIASDARNVVQTAWQVEIASSKKSLEKGRADVWNSEKQLSDRQLNIVPEGVVFEPGKLYWWRVRVWNAADEVTPWSEPAVFRSVPIRPAAGRPSGSPPSGAKIPPCRICARSSMRRIPGPSPSGPLSICRDSGAAISI